MKIWSRIFGIASPLYSDIFNLATKIATIRNVSDVVWLSSLFDDVIVL